jgi:RNA polymerase sigma-70 factor (ECF subfamily)
LTICSVVTKSVLLTYKIMSAMVESSLTSPLGRQAARQPTPGFLTRVAALVHVHRARLLAYARRHGLDAEEALDAVQDSFITFLGLPEAQSIAHDSLHSLKSLTVILRHQVQNQRRKRQRHGQAHELLGGERVGVEVPSSEQLIVHAEELARVNGCMVRMAYLEREVVMLSLLDDQPRDRVGEVLGISAGYVRVLLHRAREHLRTCSDAAGEQPRPAEGDYSFELLGTP